jgi:putative glutamate/gamma-aminobutyrate antiporter
MSDKSTAPAGGKAATTAKISVVGLVVMNILAVATLRGLPAEAEYGLGSIFYYLFAAIFFLVPVSLVAAELATGWPEKGGVFRWVGEAFKGRLAFLAVFMLFLQTAVYFPTALTFGAVSLAYVDTNEKAAASISANAIFILAVVLGIYWLATFIGLRGTAAFAAVSKWAGYIGVIAPAVILIVLGFLYIMFGNQPQIEMKWDDLIPDFSNFGTLVLAASIFLFYAGMEMNAIHVKDVKNPSKNYPLGVIIAAIGTVIIFVFGTLAIAFVVPKDKINLTQALLVTYYDMFDWAGIGWAAPVLAVALAIGVFGAIVVWVVGPATALLSVGQAGYLPKFLQKTNKHGVPTNILWIQGALVTLMSVLFVVLPTVQTAFQILSQQAIIFYLIMYMLMFAAVIRLRQTQPDRPRPYKLPFGKAGAWIIGGAGFLASLLAFVLSFFPPEQIPVGSPLEYVGILVVLTVVFVALAFLIYAIRKPEWKDPSSDMAPFSWESAEGAADASAAPGAAPSSGPGTS